jgi:ABC-type dipeptide/oligopeptide/nickel transport system permease subunit
MIIDNNISHDSNNAPLLFASVLFALIGSVSVEAVDHAVTLILHLGQLGFLGLSIATGVEFLKKKKKG